MKSLQNFTVIMDYPTICLFHCRNLSQYFKKLYMSVSIRKSNLKFCAVTCTTDTHQTPKNNISVAESLRILTLKLYGSLTGRLLKCVEINKLNLTLNQQYVCLCYYFCMACCAWEKKKSKKNCCIFQLAAPLRN